ncbi:polysaccharide deacetylase family protein [Candidatus Collierbacteria bacterium]|nr:polysaccharide deacetylase family protein [Candidatus Collierbacteria bacterium]
MTNSLISNLLFQTRRFVYTHLASIDQVLKLKNPLVILCYHRLAVDQRDRHSLDPDQFFKQIRFLLVRRRFVSLKDIESYLYQGRPLPTPAFSLTFDDGFRDVLKIVPFCQKFYLQPAVFALVKPKHSKSNHASSESFLTIPELKYLLDHRFIVGCHSASHPDFTKISSRSLPKEIILSKWQLETALHTPVDYFAYPYGRYTTKSQALVKKAGYRLSLTMSDGIISPATNPLLLPRVAINRTHTFSEFTSTFSPSVIRLRSVLKHSPFDELFT